MVWERGTEVEGLESVRNEMCARRKTSSVEM
jgi:hypothetical protein